MNILRGACFLKGVENDAGRDQGGRFSNPEQFWVVGSEVLLGDFSGDFAAPLFAKIRSFVVETGRSFVLAFDREFRAEHEWQAVERFFPGQWGRRMLKFQQNERLLRHVISLAYADCFHD